MKLNWFMIGWSVREDIFLGAFLKITSNYVPILFCIMARPRKKGLDYFPMDVNMLDSDIAVAITGKFDYVGFQCMLRILCSIYKNGYWIEFDEIFKLKLSSNLRIDNGKVEEIVNTLVEWKYFDKEIFDKYNVLTNAEIQEQYFFIVARNRNRIDDDLPYLLAENLRIIDNNCHLPQENTELSAENYDESDISREFTAGKLTENMRETNGKPAEKGGNKIKEYKTKENISKERTTTSVVVGKKDNGLFVFGDEKTTPEVVVNNNPKRFVKPTVDEVKEYITAKGYTIDAQAFMDYYESNGWKVGRNPMKDWKAALSTWQRKEAEKRQSKDPPKSFAERMYDERRRHNIETLADMDLKEKFFVNGKNEDNMDDWMEYQEYRKENIDKKIKEIENGSW